MAVRERTSSSQFSVPDMECAGCAASIERSLSAIEGVDEITTSVMTQKVTVYYYPHSVDEASIASAIRKAGYDPHKIGEAETAMDIHGAVHAAPGSASETFWKNREKLLTILSGLFFFAGLALDLIRPEQGHTYFWRGHLGTSDLLLLTAALLGGFNFFPKGIRALWTLSLDMDFLMTAAIGGAVAIGEYTEAAAIAFLFSSAELLEDYATERARSSLRALMALAPDTATILRNGREMTVMVEEVQRHELVLVRPGEKIPVDGEIVEGASSVDQSTITGESIPIARTVGEEVFAGTINQEGYLELKALRLASESTLSRILKMVEEAEAHRAPSEQFVRKFARYYTPAITLLALAVILLPPFAFEGSFETWFVRGLTLLVIACPCALVISTPVAVVSSITSAARNGVLIKGGNYLEALAKVRAVAFDKTGTLTQGHPRVTDVLPLNGCPERKILAIAAALEQRSQHPIAGAIVERAAGLERPRVEDFESLTGEGVRGRIDGTTYLVGRPELFADAAPEPAERLRREGKTAILVGTDAQLLGVLAIADTARQDAGKAIAALRRQGIERVVMLTGDNREVARAMAAELGVDEWRADLLPRDKVEAVGKLKSQYGEIAMVGDGVNDAPALAAASVGIAMGAAGADAALETADVALMGDDLAKLPYLLELSRSSRRIIRQNVWASVLVKFSLIAGVFPGLVTLIMAVLVGDMGTSLAVTGNAMRLARIRPGKGQSTG